MGDFALDKNIILCFLAIIPVIFWFLKIKKSQKVTFYGFIFIFTFSFGSLETVFISENLLRFIFETIVLFLFLERVLKKNIKLPALLIFITFCLISTVSVLINDNRNLIQLILFFRDYIPVILLIYIFINIKFTSRELFKLNLLLKYLFVSQLFAAIIKFAIVGIQEPYIGTFSNYNGSQTLIFTLFGSAYCISHYFYSTKKKYLLYILAFLGFAAIGSKRATVFFAPLLFIISYLSFNFINKKQNNKTLKTTLSIIIILPIIFYLTVRLQPSLTPENKIFGSFDLEYVINYSERYSYGWTEDEIGFSLAPAHITAILLIKPWYNSIFGFGAGHIIYSNYNKIERDSNSSTTTHMYGIGYGARSGLLQLLLQVGFLGTVIYLLIFSKLMLKVIKKHKKLRNKLSLTDKIYFLTAILFIFIFLMDFLFYAHTIPNAGALCLSFAWVISYIFRYQFIAFDNRKLN